MKTVKFISKIINLTIFLILAGCAAGIHSVDAPLTSEPVIPDELQVKVTALERAGKSVTYIYVVPQTDEFISNALLQLTTKLGMTSTAAEGVTDMVKANNIPSLTVIGKSDAITAAVIESAINNLKDVQTSTVIYFAGDRDYADHLRALAGQAGVRLEAIAYP